MLRRPAIRHSIGLALALLFGGGLALGCGAALAAMPALLDAVTPHPGVAQLSIPEGFAESRSKPQLLYPVAAKPRPDWLVEAMRAVKVGAPPPLRGSQPVIAICIDDLGVDLAGTDKAIALPKDVALSFLPFADTTPFLAEAAARAGHLVLAHVPMQPLNGADPGPNGLKPGMTAEEVSRRLGWNLARVPGLVGINNHEGSRFTADAGLLAPVMATLRARHLFFFDSRTSAQTEVAQAAHTAGVMTAARDVFLDDDPQAAAVTVQLERLVSEAKRTGVAIAIGHPHDVTLKLLVQWLAQDHGVTLVPLDEAIRMKAQGDVAVAAR